ncbi:hypothetical protein QW131_24650 [Roseibium salinum]|nr:hypothetical protein [Roseibium salinum]
MVHGASREEVQAKRQEIAALLGSACRSGDILFSTRILKKNWNAAAQKGGVNPCFACRTTCSRSSSRNRCASAGAAGR